MADWIELDYPFTGRWRIRNSPANRVPSHGTERFASAHAIDFVPVDAAGRGAPMTLRSFLRPEAAHRFSGFGRPVLAPVSGDVMAAWGGAVDHRAYRGVPSVGYALSQGRRAAAGWAALAGNHVMIDTGAGIIALCHLQQASVRVRPGQRVHMGEVVGACGNSGNSMEPHLHVQAIDQLDIGRATAVPVRFRGELPRTGQIIDVAAPRV